MPGFDAIIIGAGQARPSLAFRLAGAGMKVAVVERQLVGGTCVNTGCTPTKALVAGAYAARIARRAAEYGVMIGGDIAIDMRGSGSESGVTRESVSRVRGQALYFAPSARAISRLTRDTDNPNSRAIALMLSALSV